MALASVIKDPNAVLDYSIDWTSWLGTDTITTSLWIVPAGMVQVSASSTPTTTTVWLSGGKAGFWSVTNRITTSSGRTDDRSLRFEIKER